jgi:hypothetical protein
MTFPSFSAGEVLRATDMNAVGMWRVGGGALSGTATNFVGCFTSDYTNYRIVIDSISLSGNGDISFQYLSGSTPNAATQYRMAFTGLKTSGTNTFTNNNGATSSYAGITIVGVTDVCAGLVMDVTSPQLNTRKSAFITASGIDGDFYTRTGVSVYATQAIFDGIRFFSTQNMGGTVSIYGYRKA